MDILEIIEKKKNKKVLSKQEIQYFVDGVCSGQIKDYQTTSLLMAICLNGLNFEETFNLTMSMANSGEILDLSDVGLCCDKHSTGGVSDTTTLVVVPILASLGIKVAKMSGGSLGFTGGTADKMEVFSGYQTEISCEQFKNLVKQNNASIISQNEGFALADKIIYKLRSESGTVENISLIASSIMSKKIACGAKILVLDCKYGSGAFMKTKKDSIKLAKLMTKIGKSAGIKVCAVISNMNQPLTKYIGNNFEVYSSLMALDGMPSKLLELSEFLASKVLVMSEKAQNLKEAKQMVQNSVATNKAKQKLAQIVKSQSGSTKIIDKPDMLLKTKNQFDIVSTKDGFISKIDTAKLGTIAHNLQKFNGVFERQDDTGIILQTELADKVVLGDILATVHYNKIDDIEDIESQLRECFVIGKKPKKQKLVECVVE